MFCNGDVNRQLAEDALRVSKLLKNGLVRKVVKNQLIKILDGRDDSFYLNSSTVEIFDGENTSIDLKIIYRSDVVNNPVVSTFPAQLFVCCVGGEMLLSEYTLSAEWEVVCNSVTEMDGSFYFFGRTADTHKMYEFIPKCESAILLIGTYKNESDDVFAYYKKSDLTIEDIISSDLGESRLEFWLSFSGDLNSGGDAVEYKQLISHAKTRKLRNYLTNIM